MVALNIIRDLLTLGLTPVPVVEKKPIVSHKDGTWRKYIHEAPLNRDTFKFADKSYNWNKCDVGVLLEDHFVIDCDNNDRYEELRSKFPEIDRAPLVSTAKGKHIWFRRPASLAGYYDLADAFTDFDKVDFKTISSTGTSGLIIVPPSQGKNWIRPVTSDCAEPSSELVSWIKSKYKGKTPKQTIVTKKKSRDVAPMHIATDYTERQIAEYLDLLSPSRADEYMDWIKVGSILRNYDLFDLWDRWSSQSGKYSSDVCVQKWKDLDGSGLSIASLIYLAKQDNPSRFKLQQETELEQCIYKSISGTTYDCAKVVEKVCNNRYVCVNIKKDIWYCCNADGLWQDDEGPFSILSTQVFDCYLRAITKLQTQALAAESEQKERLSDRAKTLTDISYKFRDLTFKNKIIGELRSILYDADFISQLDSNPDLLGFTDGVYDLAKGEFRTCLPSDMVSISVGYAYPEVPLPEDEVMSFGRQVIPDETQLDYVLSVCSTTLEGRNPREKFNIWWGKGGNGKSKLIALLEKALGGYAETLPVDILTEKTRTGEGASPCLVSCKGKRMITINEPDEGVRFNSGQLKLLTGNDKIKARGLYESHIVFVFIAKPFLLCNKPPALNAKDGGMTRRLEMTAFTSKFVDNPNPDNKNEFKKDLSIDLKIPLWKEAFMQILLRYYKQYRTNGITAPQTVIDSTKEYIDDNDDINTFLYATIVKQDGGKLKAKDLWETYKHSESYDRQIKMKEFKSAVSSVIGDMLKDKQLNQYWPDWTFRLDDAEPNLNELI